MYISIGIGLVILLYVVYLLVGFSVVIVIILWLFIIFSYVVVVYLLYFVFGVFRSGFVKQDQVVNVEKKIFYIFVKCVVWMGFFINGLNLKVMLFFFLLFIVIISIDILFIVKFGYGIYLVIVIGLWFCFFLYFLSISKVVEFIGKKGYWLDCVMGVLFVGLVVKLVLG